VSDGGDDDDDGSSSSNNNNNNKGRLMLNVFSVVAEIIAIRKVILGRKRLRKITIKVRDKLRCLPLQS
jgi:hypothetical protein